MKWAHVIFSLDNKATEVPINFIEQYESKDIVVNGQYNIFWSPNKNISPKSILMNKGKIPYVEKLQTIRKSNLKMPIPGWYSATVLILADSKEQLMVKVKEKKNEEDNLLVLKLMNTDESSEEIDNCNTLEKMIERLAAQLAPNRTRAQIMRQIESSKYRKSIPTVDMKRYQKEQQQKYRDRIKRDPETYEEFKKKERERYYSRKREGKIKDISELSDEEKEARRKRWAEKTRKFRLKKKQEKELQNSQSTPSNSDVDDLEKEIISKSKTRKVEGKINDISRLSDKKKEVQHKRLVKKRKSSLKKKQENQFQNNHSNPPNGDVDDLIKLIVTTTKNRKEEEKIKGTSRIFDKKKEVPHKRQIRKIRKSCLEKKQENKLQNSQTTNSIIDDLKKLNISKTGNRNKEGKAKDFSEFSDKKKEVPHKRLVKKVRKFSLKEKQENKLQNGHSDPPNQGIDNLEKILSSITKNKKKEVKIKGNSELYDKEGEVQRKRLVKKIKSSLKKKQDNKLQISHKTSSIIDDLETLIITKSKNRKKRVQHKRLVKKTRNSCLEKKREDKLQSRLYKNSIIDDLEKLIICKNNQKQGKIKDNSELFDKEKVTQSNKCVKRTRESGLKRKLETELQNSESIPPNSNIDDPERIIISKAKLRKK